jgi:hypothetical protein
VHRGSGYHEDGRVETMFTRDVPFPGPSIMHKPQLGHTLPVHVWDKYEEYPNVVLMVNLSDAEIASYLEKNVRVVRRVVDERGVTAMHANHAVLMSVVAQRVGEATGVPYAVMPHGSALEYAVKPDVRFTSYASSAFSGARHVFVLGEEIRQRVATMLPAGGDCGGDEAQSARHGRGHCPERVDRTAFRHSLQGRAEPHRARALRLDERRATAAARARPDGRARRGHGNALMNFSRAA